MNLSPPDAATALAKGDIDAMAAWEPWTFRAVKEAAATCTSRANRSSTDLAEDLQRTKGLTAARPLERAAFYKSYREKKFKNLIQSSGGAFGKGHAPGCLRRRAARSPTAARRIWTGSSASRATDGVGPSVAESGLVLIPGYTYSAPTTT